jgi:YVTN family beta-propeller protein
MTTTITRATALMALLLAAAPAAAEQILPGGRLVVSERGSGRAANRKLGIDVRALRDAAQLAGDPVAHGALLDVTLAGTRPQRATFALPPGAAAGRGTGWRVRTSTTRPGDGRVVWKDPKGTHGPVRLLRLSRGPKGVRLVLRLRGGRPTPELPLRAIGDLVGAEMWLTIPGGDTWCTAFGGDAGGRVVGRQARRFEMTGARGGTCRVAPSPNDVPIFESDPVRPLALSPDGARLYVANTPDGRLEILDVGADGTLTPAGSVPVGLEPVSVAVRSAGEVWVVNHVSDDVSVVDVATDPPRVVRTIPTCDEPRDLVFAGPGGQRAFVTTARRGQTCFGPDGAPIDPKLTTPGTPRALVQVFDAAAKTTTPLAVVELFGDTPRALAVAPDGQTVYAAVFRSGNRTTTITEQAVCDGGADAPPCLVGGALAPGGLPAPNPFNCAGELQPETGLIVRFDPDAGKWVDELQRDWSPLVPFSLPDRDVFAIDAAATPPVAVGRGWSGVGTVLFGMAANPATGALYVANTEAHNAVRFEGARDGSCATSSVRGKLHLARVTVLSGDAVTPRHLNPHLDYALPPAPGDKARSVATPVALATDGTTLYVAALGSGVVAAFDVQELEDGTFVPDAGTHMPVSGGGPTGLVLRDGRLYVTTRFDMGVSVLDTATGAELSHVRLHDPEPAAVVAGRPFLYDARATSDNGEASCAACHVFGDLDGLAWDLGDPDGRLQTNRNPFEFNFGQNPDFASLKGPMSTQSLRGLANHGPMHWRGDRSGGTKLGDPLDEVAAFREFNPAFVSLLGRSTPLADVDMAAFTDFALALRYPPNPIRRLDNALTPEEDAGQRIYFNVTSDNIRTCHGCHVLEPSLGFFGTDGDSSFENEPQIFKIAHLRNLYQKVGMFGMVAGSFLRDVDPTPTGDQIRGFGFLHDGSIDTVNRFLSAMVFTLSREERRQVEAFVLGTDTGLAPAVGQQVTIDADDTDAARVELILSRGDTPRAECDVMVRGVVDGVARGWLRLPTGAFRSDRAGEPPIAESTLRALAAVPGQALTYTCLPPGTGVRMALDRDADGCLDGDDPAPADAGVGCGS